VEKWYKWEKRDGRGVKSKANPHTFPLTHTNGAIFSLPRCGFTKKVAGGHDFPAPFSSTSHFWASEVHFSFAHCRQKGVGKGAKVYTVMKEGVFTEFILL